MTLALPPRPVGELTDAELLVEARHLLTRGRDQQNTADRWPSPASLAVAINPRLRRTPALNLIDRALVEVANTPDGRLIITCPPQEGKSTAVAQDFPAWWLAQHPDDPIVVASYGRDLAIRNGRAIRRRIEEHQQLHGLSIAPDNGAVHDWTIEGHEGGVLSVGIGSGLTGRPARLEVIDDPIKDRREADSAAYRQRVWDWWTDVASTRLAPGAPVVVVLTRWHENDLAGRLLTAEDGHRWKVVNIPAQADHRPELGEVDPLGREPGEFMLSARGRTREQWEAIKVRSGPTTWASLYQGRPSPPEGVLFKRDQWARYDIPLAIQRSDGSMWVPTQPGDQLAQSWDMAFKGTSSADYVVGGVWLKRGHQLYLLDMVRRRMTFTETLAAVRALSARWPQAITKLVEDKANGTAVMDSLRNEVVGLTPVEPEGGKVARANAAAPLVVSGSVHLPEPEILPAVEDLVEECVVGSTMILTRQGLRRADEVQVGDEVLTHLGRFRQVTAVSEREAPQTVTIRAKTLDPITLTPDHPVYAMQVRPNLAGMHGPVGKDWVPAGEVSPRAVVLSARGQMEPSRKAHHAMTFPVLAADYEVQEIDLRAWYDTTLPTRKSTGRGSREWAVVDDGESIHVNSGRATPLRYRQLLDRRFGRICGLYLAEGSYSTGRAFWSFHKDETAYVDEVQTFLQERLGVGSYANHKVAKSWVSVSTSLPRLEAFFDTFGRGAANKRIPPWAWEAPTEFIEGLVEGWLDGDGHRIPAGWVGTTVSPHLAWGMRALATRLNRWALIRWVEPRKPSVIRGRTVTPRHAQFSITLLDSEKATHVFDGDHVGLWVQEARRDAGPAMVYNFTVAEDESYVTTGGAVHNCAAFPHGAHDDAVDMLTQAVLALVINPLIGEAKVASPTGLRIGGAGGGRRLGGFGR